MADRRLHQLHQLLRGWLGRLHSQGRAELRNLLLLLGVAAALWALVELADEVIEGETRGLDERILLAMRAPGDLHDPIGPHWVEEMARDATALGGVLVMVLVSVGAAAYLLLRDRPRLAILLALSVGGGLAVSSGFKALIDRPRPDLVPHGSLVSSASFPSGHSMMSTVVFLTLAALLMRSQSSGTIKLLLLVLAVLICLLVGISRVYLGVHWPTDVVAGWTTGAAWATLIWILGAKLRSTGAIEAEIG